MHKLKIEVTKFTIVGAVNFALTFMAFTGMLKVLAMNYLLRWLQRGSSACFFRTH